MLPELFNVAYKLFETDIQAEFVRIASLTTKAVPCIPKLATTELYNLRLS